MKGIFIASAMFVCFGLFAQKNNFILNDGHLTWEKIFNDSVNAYEYFNHLESSGYFSGVNKSDSIFTASFSGITPDFRGAGYSVGRVPMYISGSTLSGGVSVQIRNGRYRVVLRNIQFVDNVTIGSGIKVFDQGSETPIERYSGDKSFKSSFIKSPAEILDYTFLNIYKYKTTNDDW